MGVDGGVGSDPEGVQNFRAPGTWTKRPKSGHAMQRQAVLPSVP